MYTYTLQSQEASGPRFGGLKVNNWPKHKVHIWSKILLVFPIVQGVWGVCLTSQIVGRGAKVVFSKICWDVKDEVFEQKVAVLFLFFMFEKDKQKQKKQKRKLTKNRKCFGVGWKEVDFVKIGHV